MRVGIAIAARVAAATVLVGAAVPLPASPPCLKTPFKGITQTSETGEIIGRADPHDWSCIRLDTGVRDEAVASDPIPVPPPLATCFLPASPNPTVGSTRLLFTLVDGVHVTLAVYGEAPERGPRQIFLVRTLIDSDLVAGTHEVIWDGRDEAGLRVTAGIYRVVLAVGGNEVCGDIEIR